MTKKPPIWIITTAEGKAQDVADGIEALVAAKKLTGVSVLSTLTTIGVVTVSCGDENLKIIQSELAADILSVGPDHDAFASKKRRANGPRF